MDSFFIHSFKNFEYLIIDGGSTDGSLELINQYANDITYWVSEPDKGIYNAMNKGIAKAKGEYLQFLNSGDWLTESTVLDKMFGNLPVCDMLYGNMIKVLPGGALHTDKGPQGAVISLRTFYNSNINHSSVFIKRSLFSTYGLYDEHLKIASDWKFFLIAAGLNRAEIVYKNIDVAYFDMTGISNTQKELLFSEKEKVLAELVPFPVLTDYKNSEDDYIRLTLIRKHALTAKLYRVLQILLVRFSRILDRVKQ